MISSLGPNRNALFLHRVGKVAATPVGRIVRVKSGRSKSKGRSGPSVHSSPDQSAIARSAYLMGIAGVRAGTSESLVVIDEVGVAE
jgi:hypothetical protein